ncbi:MAG: hypothetical protein KF693_03520 [Nitrospira sp.]|nr:hypothetical protein [Nitrospira sp.]
MWPILSDPKVIRNHLKDLYKDLLKAERVIHRKCANYVGVMLVREAVKDDLKKVDACTEVIGKYKPLSRQQVDNLSDIYRKVLTVFDQRKRKRPKIVPPSAPVFVGNDLGVKVFFRWWLLIL